MDRKKIHRNARRNHTRIEIDISHNILRATSSPPLLTLLLLLLLLCSSLSLSSGRWVAAGVFCDMWDLRRRMIDSPSRFAFFSFFLIFHSTRLSFGCFVIHWRTLNAFAGSNFCYLCAQSNILSTIVSFKFLTSHAIGCGSIAPRFSHRHISHFSLRLPKIY